MHISCLNIIPTQCTHSHPDWVWAHYVSNLGRSCMQYVYCPKIFSTSLNLSLSMYVYLPIYLSIYIYNILLFVFLSHLTHLSDCLSIYLFAYLEFKFVSVPVHPFCLFLFISTICFWQVCHSDIYSKSICTYRTYLLFVDIISLLFTGPRADEAHLHTTELVSRWDRKFARKHLGHQLSASWRLSRIGKWRPQSSHRTLRKLRGTL